ncbi:G2/mitotic-specific cyclin-B3 [Eufriesea mexicana]|uniref:G2/mitotic-specific cyclin-B3 n=1 Tax=Eufriesea mexicana TaxID=516756 RepID=UPI00083C4B26|nr:PREDICTED: G2/mitotic-specific cyclin-B3 [Eufriesea mexicana]XP_017754800.1 PREDICTED: G2/mitotic-specific cyclin-B3 [Eufriesea mexicana]XP_017754801.1 PREDICTED: G2/mitotic-specific cyclin-B3 [Eufriesea mexicana]OAD58626.1 G2/mitotic-specific cyclin-B3 [Eufriesea mexicana]
MAPSKVLNVQNKQGGSNATNTRKRITTRSQNSAVNNTLLKASVPSKDPRIKRKAEASPSKEKTTKRYALGNITNAIGKTLGTHQTQEPKKTVKKTFVTQVKPFAQTSSIRTLEKIVTKPEVVPQKPKPVPRVKSIKKDDEKTELPSKILNVRRSLDLEKSEDSSLYVSALEEVGDDSTKKSRKSNIQSEENEKTEKIDKSSELKVPRETQEKTVAAQLDAPPERILPEGVQWDFDAENWLDPFQVSHYAMDIFNYLKDREHLFPIGDYMERQVCLSRWMRALLVDWMVEVQESFELNHETLYLAVKLVDLYLTKVTVGKETLQLLGAASLFISSKYDERIPPMVEDFLYICDGAYTQRELIRMEMSILKVIDFDLGIPLSYRFLRRYARCAKVSMPTLTLARYILEFSLMDYATIMFSDSKMAAAALLLAMQMKDLGSWTPTLEYYSGYKVDDILDIVNLLNQGLHRKHKEALTTVRNKYSHKIFFEVAKLPLKDTLNI